MRVVDVIVRGVFRGSIGFHAARWCRLCKEQFVPAEDESVCRRCLNEIAGMSA